MKKHLSANLPRYQLTVLALLAWLRATMRAWIRRSCRLLTNPPHHCPGYWYFGNRMPHLVLHIRRNVIPKPFNVLAVTAIKRTW